MEKFKIKFLFIASLVLALVLSFSVALAVEQNDEPSQEQDQVKNQEQSQELNKDESGNKDEEEFDGAEHQSVVATFVKSILEVADKEQKDVGIGEEVRVIAKEQNDVKDRVAESIDKINKRNKIKTFLIGTDYKNIGQLRSEMVKTANQIDQLKKLQDKLKSAENKTALQAQAKVLETEQQKIQDFMKANESKFSLFGWLVKLFNK